MSHPPVDRSGWNAAGWPPPEDHRAGFAGPPRQDQPSDDRPAPHGAQPRAYGRASASVNGESAYPEPSGQRAQPVSPYGAPTPQQYGQPRPTQPYGQPTQPPYGQPTQPPYGQPQPTQPYEQPRPWQPYESVGPAGSYEVPPSAPTEYPAGYVGSDEQAGRRSRMRAMLPLALAAALLLAAAGVMTALFFAKSVELNRTERELAAESQRVEQLSRDVKVANDRAAKTQQDLTGTKNSRDELERQRQVISRCLKLLGAASDAASSGDRSGYRDALEEAEPVCKEADRYL